MYNMTILTENYSYMESSILIMLLQLKTERTNAGRVGCPLKDNIILQLFWRKCINPLAYTAGCEKV
jgi:hypothetical protein